MNEPLPAKRPRGRPRKDPTDASSAPAQALDRGLQLLALLSTSGRGSLSEIALTAGMPPSTAHRLLTTMQRHGVVEFDEPSQDWMIGIEAFRIGSAFLKRTNLIEASRAAMRELMEVTGETANLGIADAGDVVFVSQVETHNPIRAFFRPGTRGHMHASGIGKALLADMPREAVEAILHKRGLPEFTPKSLTNPTALFEDLDATRLRKWAFDDEERYTGMRCIAAPIFNEHGEAIAGVSVSGPTVRLPDAQLAEIGAAVRNAAKEIMNQMGGMAPT
jgi:IclR family acetate operon transcriptional repressor